MVEKTVIPGSPRHPDYVQVYGPYLGWFCEDDDGVTCDVFERGAQGNELLGNGTLVQKVLRGFTLKFA